MKMDKYGLRGVLLMSGRDRDFLDDMMDSLDEFWLYHQATKDDDDDVDLDFDDDFDLDDDTDIDDDTDPDDESDEDFILTASGSARTAPYQNENPEIYNNFFDGKNAGYEKGYELGFFAGYDTGKCNFPDKIPESPKPKDYAFSNGFQVGFTEGYEMGYEEGCKRSGHASELEKYRHPPYTKEKDPPKQTEPMNDNRIVVLKSSDNTKPAVDSNIITKTNFVDTYDPFYKIKDFFKLIGCALLIIVVVFCLVAVVETIKKKNKESNSEQSSTSYKNEYVAKTTKYTGTYKTYTTANKKSSRKKFVYNDPDDFIDYDEAEEYYEDEW